MAVGGEPDVWMTRPMRAGALRFVVAVGDEDARDTVEAVFRDLPTAAASEADVAAFVLLPVASATGSTWTLSGPNIGDVAGASLADALALLVTGVNLSALDAEPDRLHIHAGAAVKDGRAVVMSAPRETGKTTTLARLVVRGWDFISDEAVSISSSDDDVRGFPKPLSIKSHGRARVADLAPHMVPAVGEVRDHEVVHVPLGALGATAHEAATPKLLVLLRRRAIAEPEGAPASLPVHPADATVHLMTETMDAARFGEPAVLELARLAARCSSYEILVGEPDLTADLIERLAAEPEPEPLEVELLTGGSRVAANVATVRVGDRVVLHVLPEGQILALDPMGTQIWLTLGGWPANQLIDLEEPFVVRFRDQLASLGLLAGSGPGEASS